MKYPILCLLILFSLELSARKAPKWKEGNFKTTASGLQYKIVKTGKGEAIQDSDFVIVVMSHYKNADKSIELNKQKKKYDVIPFEMENGSGRMLPGISEAIRLLKKGGKGYFKIPPSIGKKDTIFCYITVKEVISRHAKYIEPVKEDVIPSDSVSIIIEDPEKNNFGDSIFSVMKLVEVPQVFSCGNMHVLQAFKFQLSYFENGMQHKDILVFIECPDAYGKDYFVKGASYVVTGIPLMEKFKSGKSLLNAYSLEKLDSYLCLRVKKM